MPRSDGIALGSTFERNNWSLQPNEEALQRNVNRAIERFAAMWPDLPGMSYTQPSTPATPPAVESFFGEES